ncbi:hypothetical protein WJX72_002934 [[Myrmecia] bisecta]|uniref:Uncharacterized protein n=1 Tax=[Myrmecia] bisecta TaxID=41462 RepID=A0AAW1R652_9CHLO
MQTQPSAFSTAQGPKQQRKQGLKGVAGGRGKLSFENLSALLCHTTPAVPLETEERLGDSRKPCFRLESLWESFESWSSYGAEVPLYVSHGDYTGEVVQCYVPYLSAVQIYEPTEAIRRLRSTCCSFDEDDDCADMNSSETTSVSSAASTMSTDSDCEDGKYLPLPLVSDRGSILRKQLSIGEPRRLLYEFFESVSPHQRDPLTDRIQQLATGNGEASFPGLLSLRSSDIHPASWFALAWYPIYRIPSSGCNIRDLNACFLTFHSLAMPGSMEASTPYEAELAGGQPQPPQPTPSAAAAYEVRRQQYVQQHRQQAVFLQPFAFVPYKMTGNTWLEDEASSVTHAAMIAAAGAWVQRRRATHPDLEFFAQHSRNLPANMRR